LIGTRKIQPEFPAIYNYKSIDIDEGSSDLEKLVFEAVDFIEEVIHKNC
jgi:hypothetical protein